MAGFAGVLLYMLWRQPPMAVGVLATLFWTCLGVAGEDLESALELLDFGEGLV